MEKGFRLSVTGAGSMLIAGFFLPWLGKEPFMFSGFSFAVLGYADLFLLPLCGTAAIGLVLFKKKHRPYHLLYPGMAGILAFTLFCARIFFQDTGVLTLQWPMAGLESLQFKQGTNIIMLHPVKDMGIGLFLSLCGTMGLMGIPYRFKSIYANREEAAGSYREVIVDSDLFTEYHRSGLILGALSVLAVTYVWCDISPAKLWENRGNAKDYLFGRALSQSDLEYIKSQEDRAANIEAEGLARAYMSNKYRSMSFSDQPSADEKAQEREQIKARYLAQMDDKEMTRLKKDARKAALIEKKGGYFPPETSMPKVKGYIIALVETVAIAVWGTLLAVICAIPVSFFAAQNTLALIIPSDDLKSRSMRHSITFGVRRFLDSCRGFNEFVMALIFVAVIGLGPYAGILALWIHTFGILGKVFSEQIEAIESGQVEALTSTGASAAQTIAFSVMPQVLPVFVSYTLLRFESNVRSAAILGFVGAGGIGFLIFDKLNGYLFQEVCTMMIIIIITVGIIDHFCGRIRMKFI